MAPNEDARSSMRTALIEEVADLTAAAGAEDPPGIDNFARQYYARVALEDLQERGVDYLVAAARAHWNLARTRRAATPTVRVYTPTRETEGWESTHTVVEIVNDDMPFLVDSVTMELDRHGLGLHLVIHPIVRVVRDADRNLLRAAGDGDFDGVHAESFLRVEVDRETNREVLASVQQDLERVLGDVRAATGDWLKMLARLRHVVEELDSRPPPVDPDELAEGKALLDWMADQHFTLLGFREYELVGDGDDALRAVPGTGLGILRLAPERERSASFARLPAEVRRKAREKSLLVLTKANARATVHRPTYMDYVGVKKFDDSGEVVGEYRFLGLFTSSAYNVSPIEIPILRRKVAAVVDRAGFLPASHDQKDLIAVLETYPRDDLFQIGIDDLFNIAMGILQLQERRRVRLFVNRETYGRFVSCLVYVPRDRYTTRLRLAVAELLVDAYGARNYEWNTRLSESVLARLHFVLHVDPTAQREIDATTLESLVAAAARLWVDDLRDVLVATRGEEEGLDLVGTWGEAFPAAYQDDFRATDALADISQLDRLGSGVDLGVRLSTRDGSGLDLKLFGVGEQPSLSDVLPRLQHMGVVIDDEHPYVVSPPNDVARWIKYFRLRCPDDIAIEAGPVQRTFEEAFLAVMRGEAEDDGFNRLVLAAGLAWREVALLRAYSRYARQIGTLYSQSYIEDALAKHPQLARQLVELFMARLDPWIAQQGATDTDRLISEIEAALDAITSLDEDRILRSLLHLVVATTRTNWFQTDDAGGPQASLALKFDPAKIPDLPAPRPVFEIFVYSPRVEGVHLRAGRVARGGIRWSDRREDFRTEVLGLMKAQRVKNAVIVPGGAKGGFVVKQPPADRDSLQAEVVACYQTFISGLLDVTDNLVDGEVVAPINVIRYDADDPYFVVAADKGTATFSDIANEISLSRGFWLGDAFASGGSAGYDHKKMGITARGAWESVKRHFRQLGTDVQSADFTVAGIGDMSGDVFGNGMLQSRHIGLLAAFDHRHIFLDPNPDPEISFAERERLFRLARSSWGDYSADLISTGGGVYPRSAKSIPITPEVRARLGIESRSGAMPPNELIHAILCAPVDLLWNGGIGTYVKARSESHTEVGDKTNDGVRVNGADLRCRVVAEGGNLGFTQLGRIEYALTGGLINTDAIDNSAGVETSDHEVNIKVLLDAVVHAGEVTVAARNAFLAEMTDEIAMLVLRDNYRQNRALANARVQASSMEDVHARFIRALEQKGLLDRQVERLPDDEQLTERRNAGQGLTVPELAVLLAYAKITLKDELLASPLPDEADFTSALERYFPTAVRDRYGARITSHPLRREIVATALVNGMVNRAGTSFAFRMSEETGANAADIVRAHEVARAVFDQEGLWREIEMLDNLVAADTQTEMYLESRKLVERASRWLLRNRRRPLPVTSTIAYFQDRVARLAVTLPSLLLGSEREWLQNESARLAARGVPDALARRAAGLESLYTALDITDLADGCRQEVEHVAQVYCVVGDHLRLDWLRDRVVELPRDDRWQSLSRLALREDAYGAHRAVTAAALAAADPGFDAERAFQVWAAGNAAGVNRVLTILDDIRAHGVYDLATLSVALRELRTLM